MSYCRWGDGSDLYIYDGGEFICCRCSLTTPSANNDFSCKTQLEMITHIEEHKGAGHKCSQRAIKSLLSEMPQDNLVYVSISRSVVESNSFLCSKKIKNTHFFLSKRGKWKKSILPPEGYHDSIRSTLKFLNKEERTSLILNGLIK